MVPYCLAQCLQVLSQHHHLGAKGTQRPPSLHFLGQESQQTVSREAKTRRPLVNPSRCQITSQVFLPQAPRGQQSGDEPDTLTAKGASESPGPSRPPPAPKRVAEGPHVSSLPHLGDVLCWQRLCSLAPRAEPHLPSPLSTPKQTGIHSSASTIPSTNPN